MTKICLNCNMSFEPDTYADATLCDECYQRKEEFKQRVINSFKEAPFYTNNNSTRW